jgi:uncharacterized SAM-binding protein YcdF (DUF218 family)
LALRRPLLTLAGISAAILLIILLTSTFWLSAIGSALVRDEAPVRADAILVLAGDAKGERILKACELARQGFAPIILVSGPTRLYGINEADLAIRFGLNNGCAAGWLRPVYMQATSTAEEAREFSRWTGSHPEIKKLLLVTSTYHSARAARVFRNQLGGRLTITSVAAPDRDFDPEAWWKQREGRKAVFFEISKTAATWIGL